MHFSALHGRDDHDKVSEFLSNLNTTTVKLQFTERTSSPAG